MTEQKRWLLFFVCSILVFNIFTFLMERNRPKPVPGKVVAGETTGTRALTHDVPSTARTLPIEGALTTETAPVQTARTVESTSLTITSHPGELVDLRSKKYDIKVDKVGAVLQSIRLLDPGSTSFALTGETSQGIEMVRRIPVDNNEPTHQNWPLEVTFSEAGVRSYEDFNNVPWEVGGLRGDEKGDMRMLQLNSPTIRGLRVQKLISVPDNDYYSTVKITVFNDTDSTVPVVDDSNRGLTVRWGPGLIERDFHDASHAGDAQYDAAILRADDEVRMFRPSADKEPLEFDGKIEWAGVESKFFAALLVPFQPEDASRQRHYWFRTLVPASHKYHDKEFIPPLTMELSTDQFTVGPGSSSTFEFGMYLGPKKHRVLNRYKHSLEAAVFHQSWSFMRAIYLFLTDVLNWIDKYTRNYGLAIIFLTILVRLAMFPLTQKSIKIQAKTMVEMQKIKPHLDAINEKYKSDPAEKQKKIMQVYKEHNVNPFASLRGCIPLMLQMPIFIGLYRVCSDTIDLQGAKFLWVDDLSVADRLLFIGSNIPLMPTYFNLLPLLMAATQMLSTWVSMAHVTTMDPTQKQMMYMMPAIFVFMMYSLPAGLMVYWIASNIWTIFQTMITNKMMLREQEKHKTDAPASPA